MPCWRCAGTRQALETVRQRVVSGERAAAFGRARRGTVFPEPQRRQRSSARPQLIESPGVVEPPVFHYFPQRQRIADVQQRVLVENQQIRILAALERPELLTPDRLRGAHGRSAQRFGGCEAARDIRLQLPVKAQTRYFAVTADTEHSSRMQHARAAPGNSWKLVFARVAPRALEGLQIHDVVRSKAIELRS